MKTETKRILNVKACALGVTLITGALLLNANVHGFEPGEPLARLLETDYSKDFENINPDACGGERCVEWCDFTNGSLNPSGTLCCVSPDRVGALVVPGDSAACRRPNG